MSYHLDSSSYLILDPPRKGVSSTTLNIIITKSPIGIAYLSCNPATLARDTFVELSVPTWKVVELFIKYNKYDVIAYGSIVTHYKWMKWLTNTIKKYHPKKFKSSSNKHWEQRIKFNE